MPFGLESVLTYVRDGGAHSRVAQQLLHPGVFPGRRPLRMLVQEMPAVLQLQLIELDDEVQMQTTCCKASFNLCIRPLAIVDVHEC